MTPEHLLKALTPPLKNWNSSTLDQDLDAGLLAVATS
jgi:hypothetical protein